MSKNHTGSLFITKIKASFGILKILNSIRITEGSDNGYSDNQGYTVLEYQESIW